MKKTVLNIFMFHRVYPGASGGALTPACFTKRLKYLKNIYRVLTFEDLLAFLDGQDIGSGPFAALTFDDGWLDNWLYATPILEKAGCSALLALSTGYLHDGPVRNVEKGQEDVLPDDQALHLAANEKNNRAFLRRNEIKAMIASGVWNIQAHGHLHIRRYQNNKSLQPLEPEEIFRKGLSEDLQQCCRELEQLTGKPPELMFWPWGQYTEQALQIAIETGFRFSFSVKKDAIIQHKNIGFVLPRIGVSPKEFKFRRNSFVFRHAFLSRVHCRYFQS